MRFGIPILALTLSVVACTLPDRERFPMYDPQGRLLADNPDSCFASLESRRYIHRMRSQVLRNWRPKERSIGTWTVELAVRLDAAGNLKQLHAQDPENPLNDSAIEAVHKTAPFPEVPAEATCITEELFRVKFSLEVRSSAPS
jgi:hypothetical protein